VKTCNCIYFEKLGDKPSSGYKIYRPDDILWTIGEVPTPEDEEPVTNLMNWIEATIEDLHKNGTLFLCPSRAVAAAAQGK
jgi:hypothetical protein